MTEQPIDLEAIKQQLATVPADRTVLMPAATTFALIEVTEAATSFHTKITELAPSTTAAYWPIEEFDRLTAALAKFKEPT